MSILDEIILKKQQEVKELKRQTFDTQFIQLVTPFKERIKKNHIMNIVAEIKRASPSKGPIHMDVDPAAQALEYEINGAHAISVLTDTSFFSGSMDDLRAVRQVVDLPILCKDFMIDPIQIVQAKSAGANIILLIVAALKQEQLETLYDYAINLNLEVLVEVHNEVEMKRALAIKAEMIGINNRDLNTFNVDLNTTSKLASLVKNPDTILISESGIVTKEDVLNVASSGIKGILVGETLMRSTNLKRTFADLQVSFQQSEQN